MHFFPDDGIEEMFSKDLPTVSETESIEGPIAPGTSVESLNEE
jgi:hypothetical protein